MTIALSNSNALIYFSQLAARRYHIIPSGRRVPDALMDYWEPERKTVRNLTMI